MAIDYSSNSFCFLGGIIANITKMKIKFFKNLICLGIKVWLDRIKYVLSLYILFRICKLSLVNFLNTFSITAFRPKGVRGVFE